MGPRRCPKDAAWRNMCNCARWSRNKTLPRLAGSCHSSPACSAIQALKAQTEGPREHMKGGERGNSGENQISNGHFFQKGFGERDGKKWREGKKERKRWRMSKRLTAKLSVCCIQLAPKGFRMCEITETWNIIQWRSQREKFECVTGRVHVLGSSEGRWKGKKVRAWHCAVTLSTVSWMLSAN